MAYRVHRFAMRMTRDQERLEAFLNSLAGEVVTIIPNVSTVLGDFCHVDFLLVVERVHGIEEGQE